MMIGTNNLGSGELPGPTSQGILAAAEYVLKHSHPSSRLLLFQLLPRGDGRTILPNLCPPRCTDSGEPFQSFMPAINKVNDIVQAGIKPLQTKYPYEKEEGSTSSSFFSRIEFVDCGSQFLTKGTTREEVDMDLMPDRLHPNAKGMEIIADCILEFANG
jgi:lysophospholipase L1-like esterase